VLDDPQLDTTWLAASIAAESCDDLSTTAYRGVRRVEATEAVLVASGRIMDRVRRRPISSTSRGSPDQLAQDLRGALETAVAKAISGKRRAAVMVSGGLDSSSVLAAAVAAARGATDAEVDAISMSVGGPGDDRPYLRDLCEGLGIVPLRITPADARPNVLSALIADGAPQTWPTSAWEIKLMQLARERGADVVLTGVCGDQLFGGDPQVFARYAMKGRLLTTTFGLARFRAHSGAGFWTHMMRYVAVPLLAGAMPSIRRAKRKRRANTRWPWAGLALRTFLGESYVGRPFLNEWKRSTCAERVERLVRSDFLEVLRLEARRRCRQAVFGRIP